MELQPLPEFINNGQQYGPLERAETARTHWEAETARLNALMQLEQRLTHMNAVNAHSTDVLDKIKAELASLSGAVTTMQAAVSSLTAIK